MDKRHAEKNKKQSKRKKQDEYGGLFGIDAETSLQSVKFATTENPYLNDFQNETDE